jgi:hypothetical protein
MLHYPKMPGSEKAPLGERCVAFEKLDGTNLHFRFERGFGWHTLGTRRDEFPLTESGIAAFEEAHPELAGAAEVFVETLQPGASAALDALGLTEAALFAEFLGDGSFAGRHRAGEPKKLIVFDLETPSGFLPPEEFLKSLVALPTPRVLYRGKLTGEFAQSVRRGRYDVAEGVVCKGLKGDWRCKIKTDVYLARLKAAFDADWERYWE